MADMVEILAERIDIDKGAGIAPDLMQCDINHDLHYFLENKGDTWKDRKGFREDLLGELKQHEEEHSPCETQNTTAGRITLQLQQDAMYVQEGAKDLGVGMVESYEHYCWPYGQ